MSSPVAPVPPVPPLPPQLPRRRRRSFAGPVVLIIVGLVFLLGNLHMLSWMRLWTLFAHYWPALLILWGVIKLLEYQRAQREGVAPAGIGAAGIFLVVVIIVGGLISTQIDRFREHWGEIRENMGIDDEDFKDIFGESYNFDDHLAQDFPAGASLKVIDTRGAVSVHASDDNKITVVVRKRVGAGSQGDANKYNEQTKPTITTIGGLVTLDARAEAGGDHPVETELDISLPRKVPVSITSRRGEVTVSTRDGDVEIASQHADTSVEEVTGNVKLSLEKGTAKVEQITGDVHIEGRLNDVSVSDVKGTVQLNGEFMESVKLARITKNVTFKSSRTDMELSRIDGDLDLDSDDLRADQVAGPVHLSTRSKQIHLEGVSGDVRLQDENGSVEVAMRALGNVQIDSRNGDIQLSVPQKAGFRLDARARGGEIQSEFPELKVDNNDREAKASGSVGNGASHIVLNNEHSGIEIRIASPAAPTEGVRGGVPGGVPGTPKAPKALPPPKDKVEPTEN